MRFRRGGRIAHDRVDRRPSHAARSSIVPPSSSTSRRAIDEPEAGARRLWTRARSGRTRARAARRVRPAPSSTTCSSPPLRGDGDRRTGRRRVERVREQVVEHLLDPTLARADRAAVTLRFEPHAALLGERRPELDASLDDVAEAADRRRRSPEASARASSSSSSTSPASRSASTSAASVSPFSSRSRSAISGVRSSCDASATNCSCDLSSAASLAVVRLNSPARLRTSEGPSFSLARAVSSPPPTRAATLSSRRSGRAIERARSSPTIAATPARSARRPRARAGSG